MNNEPILKQIFGNRRIIGLAGEKNSGKTNNLIFLIKNLKEGMPKLPVYVYGMPKDVMKYLKTLGVEEISELQHLLKKRDCVLILDEYQKLKLNDRRFKDALSNFIDFVYHNNVYTILSSPNIREFNSIIGGVIERWLLKSVRKDSCINGSQLKKIIENYKGSCKSLDSIDIPKSQLLLINDEKEVIIECPYVKEADSKLENSNLFESQNVSKNVGENVDRNVNKKMSDK
ncbi:MAG: hypothetical protein Q8O88_00785 [bacterium]|nr:hypothetical protein [bacterium]